MSPQHQLHLKKNLHSYYSILRFMKQFSSQQSCEIVVGLLLYLLYKWGNWVSKKWSVLSLAVFAYILSLPNFGALVAGTLLYPQQLQRLRLGFFWTQEFWTSVAYANWVSVLSLILTWWVPGHGGEWGVVWEEPTRSETDQVWAFVLINSGIRPMSSTCISSLSDVGRASL